MGDKTGAFTTAGKEIGVGMGEAGFIVEAGGLWGARAFSRRAAMAGLILLSDRGTYLSELIDFKILPIQ